LFVICLRLMVILARSGAANRIAARAAGETAMLTKKQSELLRFIHERLQAEGVPPSFDEMKDALDLRSNRASIA